MRRVLLAVMILTGSMLFQGPTYAAPSPPQLSYQVSGLNVTVNWTAVAGATGYKLFYAPAPYAGAHTIGSLDTAGERNLSVNLWDGASFYVAATSRNSSGESGYSNIELVTVKIPDVKNWDEGASLGSARKNFAGGVVGRKVIVFGGESPSGLFLSTTEIYDPATGQWTSGAANSTAGTGVSNLSSAVLNGKLYAFGATGSNCSTSNFAQEYDPVADLWQALPAKPTMVNNAAAVAYNGEIYLFGGWGGSCTARTLKTEVEAYNPASRAWRAVTSIPTAAAKGDVAVAVYEGKVYLMGGSDASGRLSNQIIAYDFASKQWTTSGLGTLSSPRSFPTGAAAPMVDETILLVGGLESGMPTALAASALAESKHVDLYDPRSHSVTAGTPLPEATAGHLPAVLDGELLVIGGTTNNLATNRTWRADIVIPEAQTNSGSCGYMPTTLGSRWVYQENDSTWGYSGTEMLTVSAVNGSSVTFSDEWADEFGSWLSTTVMQANCNQLKVVSESSTYDTGTETVAYTPPLVMTPLQMTNGYHESGTSTLNSPGCTLSVTNDLLVEGQEVVTVPAGVFTAVKVRGTMTLSNLACGEPFPPYSYTSYTWFTPGVGPIKYLEEDGYTQELVSYTIR